MLKKIVFTTGALILIAFILFVALVEANKDVIARGVTIQSIAVGGMTMAEAEAALSQTYAPYENAALILKREAKEIRATPKDVGIIFAVSETIKRAGAIGKEKNPARAVLESLRVFARGENLAVPVSLNEDAFNAYFVKYLAGFEKKARDAALTYDHNAGVFQIIEEKTGLTINQSTLQYDLLESARYFSRNSIALEMQEDQPTITTAVLGGARAQANSILTQAPFALLRDSSDNIKNDALDAYQATSSAQTLANREVIFQLEKNQLKDMLSFVRENNEVRVSVNDEAIKNILIQIAPSLSEKPRDAVLSFKKGKVIAFSLSKNGAELDVETSLKNIKTALMQGERSADIALTIIVPDIRMDTIENLGFTALLGVGESNFAGSPASRAFNIKLGSEKITGILIKPQEEFSIVNALGKISEKEGYQAALVIKDKRMIKEYGGGLCQVSTTLFRAAMYAGLKITERFPHSLPVQYYNPQGFDAAMYGPHPDLRFVNDTPSAILIQAKIKGTKLIFEMYGTADGRKIKLIGPVEYDKKPDGSLKATLIREIRKDGELIATNTFKSSYGSVRKDPIVKNPLE